ncbi:MAG: ATPase domain-containing protein [Candidatus Jordarchaeales archaeon]
MASRAMKKIPSGVGKVDSLLSGGLPVGFITHIFGPKGGGKTTFSIQCALNASSYGTKVFYIDAEHSLHPKRLQQLLLYKGDLRKIMVVKPFSFMEQERIIEQLSASTPLYSLIIIDSIASMYRLELEEKEKNIIANRRLNMQLAELLAIAQKTFSAVLLTNQVTFDPETGEMRPVGENVVSYWSAVDLKMERITPGKVKVTLIKGEAGKVGSCVELILSERGLT